jgi:hypothetical protein
MNCRLTFWWARIASKAEGPDALLEAVAAMIGARQTP